MPPVIGLEKVSDIIPRIEELRKLLEKQPPSETKKDEAMLVTKALNNLQDYLESVKDRPMPASVKMLIETLLNSTTYVLKRSNATQQQINVFLTEAAPLFENAASVVKEGTGAFKDYVSRLSPYYGPASIGWRSVYITSSLSSALVAIAYREYALMLLFFSTISLASMYEAIGWKFLDPKSTESARKFFLARVNEDIVKQAFADREHRELVDRLDRVAGITTHSQLVKLLDNEMQPDDLRYLLEQFNAGLDAYLWALFNAGATVDTLREPGRLLDRFEKLEFGLRPPRAPISAEAQRYNAQRAEK